MGNMDLKSSFKPDQAAEAGHQHRVAPLNHRNRFAWGETQERWGHLGRELVIQFQIVAHVMHLRLKFKKNKNDEDSTVGFSPNYNMSPDAPHPMNKIQNTINADSTQLLIQLAM